MSRFRMRPALMAAMLCVAAVPVCSAQVLYGSLVGNVTEETQAVVPGAEVTIINKETNLTRRVLTTETGSFSFPNLVAGTYSLRVKIAGFPSILPTTSPLLRTVRFGTT